MDKAEGFRRIGKVIGIAGWLPLAFTAIFMLQDIVIRHEIFPAYGMDALLISSLLLALAKGIEWIINGFASPKNKLKNDEA